MCFFVMYVLTWLQSLISMKCGRTSLMTVCKRHILLPPLQPVEYIDCINIIEPSISELNKIKTAGYNRNSTVYRNNNNSRGRKKF